MTAIPSSPDQVASTLADALALPQTNLNGLKISLSGVLSHVHSALNDMSQPFEDMPECIQSQYDDRLMNVQPGLCNFALSELNRHLKMLATALQAGDAATVRKFLDLYIFD